MDVSASASRSDLPDLGSVSRSDLPDLGSASRLDLPDLGSSLRRFESSLGSPSRSGRRSCLGSRAPSCLICQRGGGGVRATRSAATRSEDVPPRAASRAA